MALHTALQAQPAGPKPDPNAPSAAVQFGMPVPFMAKQRLCKAYDPRPPMSNARNVSSFEPGTVH